MAITTSGTSITFNDSTVQTSAARFGGTTTTSAVDITLTASSNSAQQVTMTAAGKAVILPSATTLPAGPVLFSIANVGAYTFDVKDANGIVVITVAFGASYILSLVDNSTSGGKWNASATGSSNVITFGPFTQTATTVYNNTGAFIDCCALSSTQALIFYATGANAMSVVLATLSGGTVSLGTPVSVYSATQVGGSTTVGFRAVSLSSTSAAVFVPNSTTSGTIFGFAISVSGSTVTVGAATSSGLTCNSIMQAHKNDSTTGVLVVQNNQNTSVVAWSVSGTTITFGSAATNMISVIAGGIFGCVSAKSDTNTFIVITGSDSGSVGNLKHRAFTISGTTITLGTTTTSEPTYISYAEIMWNYKGYAVSPSTGVVTALGPTFAYSVTYSGTTFSSTSVVPTVVGATINNYVWFRTTSFGSTGAVQFMQVPNNGFGGTMYRNQLYNIVSTSYIGAIQYQNFSSGYTGSGWTGVCSFDSSTGLWVGAQVVGGSQYLLTQVLKYNG